MRPRSPRTTVTKHWCQRRTTYYCCCCYIHSIPSTLSDVVFYEPTGPRTGTEFHASLQNSTAYRRSAHHRKPTSTTAIVFPAHVPSPPLPSPQLLSPPPPLHSPSPFPLFSESLLRMFTHYLRQIVGPALLSVHRRSLQQPQGLRRVLPPYRPAGRAIPLANLPRRRPWEVPVCGVSHPLEQGLGCVQL